MTVSEAMLIEPIAKQWWIDSEATRHVARNYDNFVDLKDNALGKHQIYMGNNIHCDVIGEGTCKIETNGYLLVLKDTLYEPNICRNHISVSVLERRVLI